MNLKIFLLCFQMFNMTLSDKIVTFPGTVTATNYSIQLSEISFEKCAENCLSNIDCVAFLVTENCSIYTFEQLISVQNIVSSNQIVGIKINGSDSETCPSSFSSLDLSGSVRSLSYNFITASSPGLFNFNRSSCSNGWKLFRRVRGYYCIKIFFPKSDSDVFNSSYCKQYSAYLTGFDNQNEIDYIYSAMQTKYGTTDNKYLAIDGIRKPSCYTSTKIKCGEFEWTNNYSSTPMFFEWDSGEPSGVEYWGTQENCLSVQFKGTSKKYANDIGCESDLINGHVCGMPIGDWDN
ncbi:unnamed protein product [Caenorhabditis angaria]|uniref:C-type lectin domain-containing protein n=1 Tax=Caenorhabditis angaria TaxID=860376 RepID=A0A9P1ID53_9PELO|nr:unnamed protein product [Caenorhabditis angaria]